MNNLKNIISLDFLLKDQNLRLLPNNILKQICRENKFTGHSKYINKNELIKFIKKCLFEKLQKSIEEDRTTLKKKEENLRILMNSGNSSVENTTDININSYNNNNNNNNNYNEMDLEIAIKLSLLDKLQNKLDKLQNKLEKIIEGKQCNICYEAEKNCIFWPCRHMFSCYECSEKCNQICPICRENASVEKIYET